MQALKKLIFAGQVAIQTSVQINKFKLTDLRVINVAIENFK